MALSCVGSGLFVFYFLFNYILFDFNSLNLILLVLIKSFFSLISSNCLILVDIILVFVNVTNMKLSLIYKHLFINVNLNKFYI